MAPHYCAQALQGCVWAATLQLLPALPDGQGSTEVSGRTEPHPSSG
jgi:hypothetical protein